VSDTAFLLRRRTPRHATRDPGAGAEDLLELVAARARSSYDATSFP